MQIDSFMELSKEKRPPKWMWSRPEELEDWFDRVFDRKKTSDSVEISFSEVER